MVRASAGWGVGGHKPLGVKPSTGLRATTSQTRQSKTLERCFTNLASTVSTPGARGFGEAGDARYFVAAEPPRSPPSNKKAMTASPKITNAARPQAEKTNKTHPFTTPAPGVREEVVWSHAQPARRQPAPKKSRCQRDLPVLLCKEVLGTGPRPSPHTTRTAY